MKISGLLSITVSAAAFAAITAGPAAAEYCGQKPIGFFDTGTGCMLIGQTGSVQDPCCQYIAPSDEPANVYAATRDSFNIWVVRECPLFPDSCTPSLEEDDCTEAEDNTCTPLLDGNGQPVTRTRTVYLMQVTDEEAGNDWLARPYRGKIKTRMGEEVSVKFGDSGGKSGVISVGQDEAIMNAVGLEGGLPLPDPPALP